MQRLIIVTLSEFGKLRTSGEIGLEKSTRLIDNISELECKLLGLSPSTDDEYVVLKLSSIIDNSCNKINFYFLDVETVYPLSEKAYLKYTQNYYPIRNSDPYSYSRDHINTCIDSIIKRVSEEKNQKVLSEIFDITKDGLISFHRMLESVESVKSEENPEMFLTAFKNREQLLQFERKILLPNETLSFCKDVIALSFFENSKFLAKYNAGDASILDTKKLNIFFEKFYPEKQQNSNLTVFHLVEYNSHESGDNKAFAVQLLFFYIQYSIEQWMEGAINIFDKLIDMRMEYKAIQEYFDYVLYLLFVKKYRYSDIYDNYYEYMNKHKEVRKPDSEYYDIDPKISLNVNEESNATFFEQTLDILKITDALFKFECKENKLIMSSKKDFYSYSLIIDNKEVVATIQLNKNKNLIDELNKMGFKLMGHRKSSKYSLIREYSDTNLSDVINLSKIILDQPTGKDLDQLKENDSDQMQEELKF